MQNDRDLFIIPWWDRPQIFMVRVLEIRLGLHREWGSEQKKPGLGSEMSIFRDLFGKLLPYTGIIIH